MFSSLKSKKVYKMLTYRVKILDKLVLSLYYLRSAEFLGKNRIYQAIWAPDEDTHK